MDREAIEEAIEVLEDARADMLMETGDENYYSEAIAVLRQALETEQQPVAHVYLFDKAGRPLVAWDNAKDIKLGDKLYTAPPKQWVSLTDQEVWEAIDDVLEGGGWLDVARTLEQAFREKNT